MRPDPMTITAVLVLDDRDHALESDNGAGWREWLRLSNWFGLRDNHVVTARSLLAHDPTAPDLRSDTVADDLPPEWQRLVDESISDAERALIRDLSGAGVPLPAQGFETDDGEVVDLAWPGARVGVLFDRGAIATNTLTDQGWTVCPPEMTPIIAALTANGVM
ncbi:helicase [Mycobacteroides abscessus subsp. abscessus]|nr:helicase [Mycobacteroides abscessus subsp. abscessus]